MKALDIVYNNLKEGKIYGCFEKRYTEYFSENLSYDNRTKSWIWEHYGRSAEKATKKNLLWIINDIFRMDAEDFLKEYNCYSISEIHERLGY